MIEKYYEPFIWCWIALGIITGIYLLKQEAPYGRFSSNKWGPMISNRLGWFLMETTVLIAFFSRIPFNSFQWFSPAGIMIAFFTLHYLHRSFVYPLMIRTNGKKMPLVILLSAILFNTVNGSVLGLWFGKIGSYPDTWCSSVPFIIGTILFFAGMIINWRSDYYLIQLRGKGDTGYKLPLKGLFRYLTSPNLSGEILEWTGYAILTWSLPAFAFAVWTCANLVPRAIANQRWYQQQFDNYPVERKVLIPFIW